MIGTAVLILSECELRNYGTTYMDLSFEDESECGVSTVGGPPHCDRGRGLCRNPRPCFLRLISRPLQLQKRSMSQRPELSLHRCRLHKLCKVHLPCFPLQVSATCNSDSQKRAHNVVLENQSNERKAQPRFSYYSKLCEQQLEENSANSGVSNKEKPSGSGAFRNKGDVSQKFTHCHRRSAALLRSTML